MKLPEGTHFYRAAKPWVVRASVPADLENKLRPIPGCEYSQGAWNIPAEVAALYGLSAPQAVSVLPGVPAANDAWKQRYPGAFPWQAANADALRSSDLTGILNDEMGLGKTASALYALSACTDQVLVVSPANVTDTWNKEIWRVLGKEAAVIEDGASAQAFDWEAAPQFVVISYGLVHRLKSCPRPYRLVLDELHYAKNPRYEKVKRGHAVRHLAHDALSVIGLTGTLISDQTPDLWHQLDLVWKGRFGRDSWDFATRYNLVRNNGYGREVYGQNPHCAEELRLRLAQIIRRKVRTDEDVKHLLPTTQTRTVRIKPKKVSDLRKVEKRFYENFRAHEETMGVWLDKVSDLKRDAVVSGVKEAQEQGRKHVCVLVYRKETARALAQALGATCITGELTKEERIAELERAAQQETSVVVCTMHSIGTGINALNYVDFVAVAELYWQPFIVEQALGRFGRLGGTTNVIITFYIAQRTLDEKIAYVLGRKIKESGKLLTKGVAETQIESAVGNGEMTREAFVEALRGVSEGAIERDDFF